MRKSLNKINEILKPNKSCLFPDYFERKRFKSHDNDDLVFISLQNILRNEFNSSYVESNVQITLLVIITMCCVEKIVAT